MSDVIPEVKRCPLCDCDARLHEGFDIDCESTTAIITCTACAVSFGPMYPDAKADVVKFVERWNERLQGGSEDEDEQPGWCGHCACQSCHEAQRKNDC